MRKFVIVVCLFFLSVGVEAQQVVEKEINEQVQFWWSINATSRLSNKWGLMTDLHVRRNNFLKDPNFYFLRAGAVYWVNDNFTLAGGVAHLWLATATDNGTDYAGENRLYQQVQWREKINKLSYLFRVRNEQRWHEVLNNDGTVNRVRFSNRVRFLFSVTIPVFKNPQLPAISIADEMLIHFGKEIVYNTFDQNRVFVGVKQKLGKRVSFDLGYMMVYQQKYSGYQYDMNHTFRWFFYYSPDFRKKADREKFPHYAIPGDE
jgi:hypothetical protein